MKKTTVHNIRNTPLSDPDTVYIGRRGKGRDGYFGNPIRRLPGEPPGSTLERYRAYFYNRLETDPEFKQRVDELKGKKLVCFCAPKPCHGDIMAEYLNN